MRRLLLKGTELAPPFFWPRDNNYLSVLRSGNPASVQTSFVQTINQTLHETHSFMKNRHDEAGHPLEADKRRSGVGIEPFVTPDKARSCP
ncbi:hypothetical protein AGR4B_pAt10132 [Agrobacterium tumefaciens str. CFBP 5621]|nr:hypothetical protein AGR4B_pAt10132 [Agrobacterium tumefaciens str. CFBP 5621]